MIELSTEVFYTTACTRAISGCYWNYTDDIRYNNGVDDVLNRFSPLFQQRRRAYSFTNNGGTQDLILIPKEPDEYVDFVYTENLDQWYTINFTHLWGTKPVGEVTGVGVAPLEPMGSFNVRVASYAPGSGTNDEEKSRIIDNSGFFVGAVSAYGLHDFPRTFQYFGKNITMSTNGAQKPVCLYVKYKLHDLNFRGFVPGSDGVFAPRLAGGFYLKGGNVELASYHAQYIAYRCYMSRRYDFSDQVLWNSGSQIMPGGVASFTATQTGSSINSHLLNCYRCGIQYNSSNVDVPYWLTLNFAAV